MSKAIIIRAGATLEAVTITRTAAAAPVTPSAPNGELEVRLVEWGVPAEVSDDGGRTRYRETWESGSIVPAARVAVYGGHQQGADGRTERGPLIGVMRDGGNRDDGFYATLALADTGAARDVRELARLVGAAVSIEAEAPSAADGADVIRSAADPATLTGVAVLLPPARPAHAGAQVLTVRAASPTDPPEDPDGEGDDGDDVRQLSRGAVAEEVRAQLARIGGGGSSSSAHPLARFRSLGDWWLEASVARSAQGEDRTTLARALADQITTNNPGVVPPGWVQSVQGIISRPRRAISAFGSFSDPGYGMEVDYPVFAGNLAALVGEQVTEKTPITSVRVDLGKGSVDLTVLAGGSDISYPLLRRSSPSYREAYLRIMSNAYAVVSEAKAAAAALAGGTGTAGPWTPGSGTADQLRGVLFEASAEVEAATGAPASFALASTDMFVAIGGMAGLWPGVYGTTNVAGTAQASTLNVNISGLPVLHVPSLTAGSLLVSNEEAAGWIEDGPFAVTAEDVELLGQNFAIWGLGGLAIPIPAGIVKVTATAARSSSK